jgi:predicted dehydrogenase
MPRRRFLRHLGGSILAAPFVTSGLLSASPNGKLRHASFGAGGMAWNDLNALVSQGNLEVAAVADVDRRTFARIREHFPQARCYQDWRDLLAEMGDQLDSVNVSTPDHMHGAQALGAMARGLHVYGQKPLAQNIAECRAVTLKARRLGLTTQMGIQLSSGFSERLVAEIVADGVIGEVREVHTFSSKKWGDTRPRPDRSDPVAEELDWDGWLGVAEDRSYINNYYHPDNWRRRRDFGTGTLGDMGCHIFSAWFRALGLTAPISVQATGAPLDRYNWGTDSRVDYLFPGSEWTGGRELPVIWYDGDLRPPQEVVDSVGGNLPAQGSVLVGSEGVLLAQLDATPRLFPEEKFAGYRYPRLEPRNHYGEFVEVCRSGDGRAPSANFEYGGLLSETVLLGCIASAFPGQTLGWDPAAMKIDRPEADRLVRRSYRPGWELEV